MIGRLGVSSVYSVVILQTTELFATDIRASAVGASSTMAHIAAMCAPFIVDYLVNRKKTVINYF